MMYGWDISGLNGWFMLAAMALIALAIVVSVWLIARRPATGPAASPSANDILRERFARGEITKEQYEDAKRTLG